MEANLQKSVLEAAGISAIVAENSVAGLYPNLSWAEPRLLVASAQSDEAARILREFKQSRTSFPAVACSRRIR